MDDTELMREGKPSKADELRMCLVCRRFFSNKTFYKHKKGCSKTAEALKPNALQPLIHKDSDFAVQILNKFRDGDVGDFIREMK